MKTTKTRPTLMSRARTALASLAAALFAAFTASAATMTQLVNGPSDIRVAPLVEASWAQGVVGSSTCYNSKTPENCLCGCVATAAGQIMRKWQYPTTAAKKVTNTLKVNGTEQSCTMLGGPGVSYDWANMPFNPANEASLTDAQRNAIGTLLYDIGVAAEMTYATSSSATYTSIMFEQFTETFGYSNAAIVGNPAGTGLSLEQFTQAVLPSLDAGMPVMVGIGGANTAHSVICDGYGYQDGDLYIHINMGWSNDSNDPTTKFNNTWYKFPTAVLNTSTKEYISGNDVSLWPSGEQSYLNPAVYNISPTMPKGASIVSGRIFSDATDSVTLQGATVVALNTSGETVCTTTSDAKGIYALILPAGTYTLRAMASDQTKGARRLVTVTATAGTRSGATATGVVIGNRHGIDFHLTEDGSAVLAAGLASTPIALAHRWSFNGDLKDSVGTAEAQPVRSWYESNSAHVTVGDGVEPVFDGNAVKLGAENYTTSGKATSLNLGTGLVSTNDVTIEIWATRRSIQNNARMFDWGNGGLGTDPSQYVCLPWYAWGKEQTLIWNQKGGNSAVIANCFENSKKYHVVLTVRQDGTSSVFNLVRRVASDISDVKRLDPAQTCENWTLSNVVGGRLYLGHSQWPAEAGSDANATYDEVRIWNGVVPDELLAVNAAMGPDALALRYDADGKACFDIPAGATLPINANTIGNNYTLAGSVTFGAGAKIQFDTANNPAGMSFTAEGGFTGVTAENVANYVTHTSTAAYDVTLSGNTITVTPARLAHRWSFNGNLEDSAGTATAQPIRSSTSGVTFGGCDPVFDGNAVKLGAENFATSGKATSLNLGTNLVSESDITIEMWATRRSTIQNGARLFDWGNGGYDNFRPTQYICMPWYNSNKNNSIIWVAGVGGNSATYTDCFTKDERYHIVLTIWKDGTTSKCHFVRRDASLAKKEYSDQPFNVLLSDVVSNWRFYLGHSQWAGVGADERDNDANATYDEVRIWNGVVPDALLAVNAAMGPDALALRYDADGKACFDIPAGATLPINANTLGNNYTLAGSVTFGAGAKIQFDTANNPAGMSFTAEGGFTGVTAANVADYVTHTSTAAYDVTLRGNTITVTPARLAHRWSFNGNLEDSAGTATAQPIRSSTSGVTFGGCDPVFDGNAVKLGAENFATSGKATSLNLGTNLVSESDITIEMWATRRSTIQDGARLFDWGNGGYDNFRPTQYICMPWYNSNKNNSIIWVAGVGGNSATYTDCFTKDEMYHIVLTIWKDGTTSKCHFVRRDASLAKKEYSDQSFNVLLSDVVSNWRFYLGHSQWAGVGADERGKDANATYDEVRIWNGVVPDALLALNADMGPDTMALKYDANGIASVVIPDGKTLHVNENTVGDYTLAGSVTLEGSARIEFNFDTALHPNGMSFTAEGGFTGITSANVADYVTVPEGYDVTLSGNTLSVAPATATSWTGVAGDGDWNNAANWTKGVPTSGKDATILASATTMPLTVPANAAYASFTVAGGALAANTDWSGLAKKPVISGTVDLNGHDLMMPSVGITIAQSGAAFVNSAATTNEVRFLANDATVTATEATYINGIAYLTTAANARIAIVHSSGDSSGTLNVGAANNHTAFRAESGTVSMSANGNVGMTSGGVGYLDVAGGTVDFCTANDRGISLGGANARAIVNISGGKLRANWIDAGHNDVTECTIVQTGGEVETGINNNGNLWLGRHGRGKATYTLSNGSINVTKGTFDVGNYGTATFTQDGGTVTVAASNLRVGAFGNSTGTYAMSDGSIYVTAGQLDVGADGTGVFTQDGGTVTIAASDLYVGRNSGSTGTYTLNGGKITPKYWQWVGNIGTGTFIQNGGTNHVWGSNNNVLAISGRGGSGTYVMNGGLLEVQSYIRVGGWHNPGTGVLEVNGGTIITPSIDRTQAQGVSTVKLNGGTIKASANGNILKSIGNVVFGGNATTIDTDGYSTAITGCGYDTIGGGSLVKAGAGTLTVDAMPPVSTLVVSNGTLALSAAADNSKSFAALAHRWSFNGDLADSVGGCTATTIGSKTDVNYVNDNTAVQTGSDQAATYATSLNLGKALSAGEAVTVEIWAKRNELKYSGMRLFDWGLSNTDYICVSWNDNANVWVKTENRDRTGTPAGLVNGCFGNGVNYHLGVTFTANANGTTTIRVVRHNLDVPSEEAKKLTTTFPSCDLLKIIAGNLYLGHSQYPGESQKDATATYDEVRVWKGILSDDALALSAQKGADATTADIAAIVAKNAEAGTVTRTLDLAGGTLDMGGNMLTQPSVVLGGGTVQNGTLVVNGTINLKVDDYIVNTGMIDLSNATINLVDPENLAQRFAFIRGGTIVGNPAVTNLPKGWKVKKSSDGTSLMVTKIKGVMVIAK